MTTRFVSIRFASILKPVVFFLILMPGIVLVWQVYLAANGQSNALGADPGKSVVQFNGDWALRSLLLTLAVTPLRQMTGWAELARIRRMLGLFAFFYATLHFIAYLALMLEFRFDDLGAEIVQRPYMLVGFLALCCLVPLALTSNQWMIRRLKQRWRRLHQWVYVIAVLQIAHVLWLTRSDYTEPLLYSAVLAVLMGYRVLKYSQRQAATRRS